MEFVSEAEAKAIVSHGLDTWRGTFTEFRNMQISLLQNSPNVNSVEKREDFLRKTAKKYCKKIYIKEVKAEFSHRFAIAEISNTKSEDADNLLSKSQRRAQSQNQQKLNQHLQTIKNKRIHAFVVKNDTNHLANELLVMIFKTTGKNKEDLFNAHSVATIKRHCLERLVQRLGLDNIFEAVEEVLGAIVWLEGSGSELAGRKLDAYGKDGLKRHIPTPNGALLLKTSGTESSEGKPTQDCSLITWIHKNQFKNGQEVTKKDFIFVQIVNYYLSDPELDKRISELKERTTTSKSNDNNTEHLFNFHGENYPASQFISALEKGTFLDFMIDFEKGAPTKRKI